MDLKEDGTTSVLQIMDFTTKNFVDFSDEVRRYIDVQFIKKSGNAEANVGSKSCQGVDDFQGS